MDLLKRFRQGRLWADMTRRLAAPEGARHVWVEGLAGSSKSVAIAALALDPRSARPRRRSPPREETLDSAGARDPSGGAGQTGKAGGHRASGPSGADAHAWDTGTSRAVPASTGRGDAGDAGGADDRADPAPPGLFGRILVVTEGLEEAYRLRQDLTSFIPDHRVHLFPGPEIIEGRVLPLGWQELIHRLRALLALAREDPAIVITTPRGLSSRTLLPSAFRPEVRTVSVGGTIDREALSRALVRLGYARVNNAQTRGEFSIRGGIIDVFPPHESMPHRIELDGDEVEEIRTYEAATQRGKDPVAQVTIGPVRELIAVPGLVDRLLAQPLPDGVRPLLMDAFLEGTPKGVEALLPYVPEQCGSLAAHLSGEDLVVLDLSQRAIARARQDLTGAYPAGHLEEALAALARRPLLTLAQPPIDLGAIPLVPASAVAAMEYHGDLGRFVEGVRGYLERGLRVVFACSTPGNIKRAQEIFLEHKIPATAKTYTGDAPVVSIVRADIEAGYVLEEAGMAVLSENDLWKDRSLQREDTPSATAAGAAFSDFTEVEVGTLVVHTDHGIGRFNGLTSLVIDGIKQEFLEIAYAKGDKVFVPVSQLDRVQRFVGTEEGKAPSLSTLGSARWQKTKAKAAAQVKELADRLLKLYARREVARAVQMGDQTVWEEELAESFPFEETPDQLASMGDVKRDLAKERPMDRLICGDVGYGKTEIAVRAAFKAVQEGKQVAVLVPTTVLAQQHYHTFRHRLTAFPVTVDVLSRLRTKAQQDETLAKLAAHKVDVLIGTHRLLGKDVLFADLGLMIIDEEQRFGVSHKERLKEMRAGVHCLTLTATPIPRTLNLAMGGLRDVSLITTPPRGRIPIRTFVMEFDEGLVKGAIERELARKGQVFYVYNRIGEMEQIQSWLARLAPRARIQCGHGQMSREALEKLMDDFYEGRFDVLLSTTIIESGLDIPNVNTIIVHDATRFGLSQLYQLRGRVGRSERQAYAYFLFPGRTVLTELAFQRLKALEEHTELGAGFKIAMRDMELRGVGNLLGAEQSGFLQGIGFELFTRLLKEAVADLSGREDLRPIDLAAVEVQVDCFIPESYIADHDTRILFYRKLAEVDSSDGIEQVKADMIDRFGPCPGDLGGLLRLIELRVQATQHGLAQIKQKGDRVRVVFDPRRPVPPGLVERLMVRYRRMVTFEKSDPPAFWLELGMRRSEAILELLEGVVAHIAAS